MTAQCAPAWGAGWTEGFTDAILGCGHKSRGGGMLFSQGYAVGYMDGLHADDPSDVIDLLAENL